MLNKRLGAVLLVMSVAVSAVVFGIMVKLDTLGQKAGCWNMASDCVKIQQYFSFSHIVVGIMAFVFSLGVYLIFFSKGEEAIIKRLEDEKKMKIEGERFGILLKGFDEFERKILTAIREQQGILQSTLVLRVSLSKAKVSQVLQELEKKNLIRRKQKGRTNEVYFVEGY